MAASARRVRGLLAVLALAGASVCAGPGVGEAGAHQRPSGGHGIRLPLPGGGWVSVILPVRSITVPPLAGLTTLPDGDDASATPTATASASASTAASAVPLPVLTPLLARVSATATAAAADAEGRTQAKGYAQDEETPAARPRPAAARLPGPVARPGALGAPAPRGPRSAPPQALRATADEHSLLTLGIGLALIGAGTALLGFRLRRQ